jgi:hypothetical protein
VKVICYRHSYSFKETGLLDFLSIGLSKYIINTYSKQKAVAGRQVIEMVLDGWTMHKKKALLPGR